MEKVGEGRGIQGSEEHEVILLEFGKPVEERNEEARLLSRDKRSGEEILGGDETLVEACRVEGSERTSRGGHHETRRVQKEEGGRRGGDGSRSSRKLLLRLRPRGAHFRRFSQHVI